MRKSLLLTMAAALTAALSMTSCSNDVEELAPAAAKKQLTVTLTLPGNDAGTRATFEANMDGSTFNGLKSKWEADDEISVVMFNSDGSIDPDKVATFKQSGTLGNDGKTATFAGDALEAWGEIADGTYFSFAYPKLNTGDYYRDWSKQKGTLESLPKYDDLWFLTKYKDGKFELQDNDGWSPRSNFFLRFPKGMAIETEFNGNIILKFSCSDDIIVSKLPYEVYHPSDFIYATLDNPIEVGPVGVTDGTLSEDVYVALESLYAQGVTSLDIAITAENGSWSKKYQLNYEAGLEMAQIYTITNGSSNLTLKEYLKVGMLMNSDGTFSTTLEEGKTPIGIIAYLGRDYTEDVTVGGGHGLVMALKNAYANEYWSNKLNERAYDGNDYVTKLDDLTRTTGWSGYNATISMAAVMDGENPVHISAYYARHYSATAPEGTTGWFLPSAQQWVKMITGLGGLAKSDLAWDTWFDSYHSASTKWEAALKQAGEGNYDSFTDEELWYWTSSETSEDRAVTVVVNNDSSWGLNVYGCRKDDYPRTRVRAVLAF